MKHFDIVVVGAGPAGCQCARVLAKSGYQVLLAEQHEDFYQNNFSSAASPLKTLERFDLPVEVVGSFWRKLAIITTHVQRNWEASNLLGVVFDFAKLRAFLAKDVELYGGEVWLGHRYIKSTQEDGKALVVFKQKKGDIISVSTKVLVDATGFARSIIYANKKDKPRFLKGTGIEYLIEVEAKEYQKYAETLVFFMGYQWSPKGYSWIFPMGNNQLKVGVAWLDEDHKIIKQVKPLKDYINSIIQDYLKLASYQILDRHGSVLEYSRGLNDLYFRDQIIAIGDAVSTVNFLGGEGIRHGMQGAEIASQYIQAYLKHGISDFKDYQREMYQYFAAKWNLSEKISRRVYLEYNDQRIDQGVAYLSYLSLEDLIAILFDYKFEKFYQGLKGYLFRKISAWLQRMISFTNNKQPITKNRKLR